MESLKTDVEVSAMKAKTPDQKIKIDRVTLNKSESEKINTWLQQINESSRGFLELTRSDLVNFLINSHAEELTKKEIKYIRLAHYSLIKHLNWITPQLKKALAENNLEVVKTLQEELQGLELGVITSAKINSNEMVPTQVIRKKRSKKSNNNLSEDSDEFILSENKI